MFDDRPNPDVILARVQEESARAGRGKLKIFFGYAAGVGKTFEMLSAAQRERAAGTDVVVGYVEPHGRPETEALLKGLETLPLLDVTYRGTSLREFDLDAALARRPTLLLVDELAHTNAPGMRHPKRRQDVEELLAAGISVWTTLNVQHIESLNDVITQITGVAVKETLPDTRFAPAIETAGHRAPRTIAFRQIAPRGTGAQHPQDAVEDASMIQSGSTRFRFLRWKQRLEPLPLRVGEFFSFHTSECTPPSRVCKHALEKKRRERSLSPWGTKPGTRENDHA